MDTASGPVSIAAEEEELRRAISAVNAADLAAQAAEQAVHSLMEELRVAEEAERAAKAAYADALIKGGDAVQLLRKQEAAEKLCSEKRNAASEAKANADMQRDNVKKQNEQRLLCESRLRAAKEQVLGQGGTTDPTKLPSASSPGSDPPAPSAAKTPREVSYSMLVLVNSMHILFPAVDGDAPGQ